MIRMTVWIRFDGQKRWHIAGLWDKHTVCGKPVTGDEDSAVYVPSMTPICSKCLKVSAES